MKRLAAIHYRLLPIQSGILLTFALLPLWYRFNGLPKNFGSFGIFYSLGFAVFWPMLWTVLCWFIVGFPGLRDLWRDRLRLAWAAALFLLVAWVFLSWIWGYTREFRPEVTLSSAIPFGMAALFALVVACAAPPARAVVAALVVGLVWNSLLAIVQVAQQHSVGLRFLGEFSIDAAKKGIAVVEAGNIRWLRPYALLPHPNILAGFLVIALLAAAAWVLSRQTSLWFIATVIFLVGLWALLLTFSRSAWLGFGAGALAMLPLIWRARFKGRLPDYPVLVTLGLVVVLSGVFALVYRPLLAARAGEGGESVELRSISDRAVYNDMAVRAILESPVTGVGIGNFPWIAARYLTETDFDLRGQPAHHVFLSAWAELGLVGFILTASMLVLGVEAALRAIRNSAQPHEALARTAFLGGVVALMVIGLLDHYPWTLLQFQIAWWGLLALAGRPSPSTLTSTSPEPIVQTTI